MPFFDINIDNIASKLSDYGKCVLEGLEEWKEMKERRENGKISTHDYIEWKLNFMNETIKLEVDGKSRKDGFLLEHK